MSTNRLPIFQQKSPQSMSIVNCQIPCIQSCPLLFPPVPIVNFHASNDLHLAQLFVVKREHARVFAIQLHLLITLLKIMLIKIIMISQLQDDITRTTHLDDRKGVGCREVSLRRETDLITSDVCVKFTPITKSN